MSEFDDFQSVLAEASHVTILSGAGISAESGIPTFRGEGGLWRECSAMDLATPEAFQRDPSLVWEFYHYRRDVVAECRANRAHLACAALQRKLEAEGRRVSIITQNIDRLHQDAGATDVIELHGSLWLTRCLACGDIRENRDSPIVEALRGHGKPDGNAASIPPEDLPRCTVDRDGKACDGLLRPHVVWFGESLDEGVLAAAFEQMERCDLFLVIGTSAVVYPAAAFAPMVANRGVPVAEFNLEATPTTGTCRFAFQGKAGELLPTALGLTDAELDAAPE